MFGPPDVFNDTEWYETMLVGTLTANMTMYSNVFTSGFSVTIPVVLSFSLRLSFCRSFFRVVALSFVSYFCVLSFSRLFFIPSSFFLSVFLIYFSLSP